MRRLAVLTLLLASAPFVPVPASASVPPVPVSTAADPVRTVDIIGSDDMKFNLTTIAARRGETLRIRLISKGVIPKVAMAHNVVVLKLGTDVLMLLKDGAPHRATDFISPAMQDAVVAKTPLAGPGETVQVSFTVPSKPGSYPFICTFPGHYQAGMKGILVVK